MGRSVLSELLFQQEEEVATIHIMRVTRGEGAKGVSDCFLALRQ